MRKVRRICTMEDCIKRLHYILYNCYYTDLLMHKQGMVYEIEGYQKKTINRLKLFFAEVKKVIETTEKKTIIKIIQEKDNIFLENMRNEKKSIYSPEKVISVAIPVAEIMLLRKIKAMLAEEPFAKKSLNEILEVGCFIAKKMHCENREELKDYGYIIKKEKVLRLYPTKKKCYDFIILPKVSRRPKIKKTRRLRTIYDCIKRLQYILYNYYFTDLLMCKQGAVYEIESYQKRTMQRLKKFFTKLEKVIEKSKKEEIIKTLQEKENFFLKSKKYEKITKRNLDCGSFFVIYTLVNKLLSIINEMIKKETFSKKRLEEFLKREDFFSNEDLCDIRKDVSEGCGYEIKKEKVVQYLKR